MSRKFENGKANKAGIDTFRVLTAEELIFVGGGDTDSDYGAAAYGDQGDTDSNYAAAAYGNQGYGNFGAQTTAQDQTALSPGCALLAGIAGAKAADTTGSRTTGAIAGVLVGWTCDTLTGSSSYGGGDTAYAGFIGNDASN